MPRRQRRRGRAGSGRAGRGGRGGDGRASGGPSGGACGRPAGAGPARPAAHVDDEPGRVVEVEDLVLPDVLEVEHDADDVVAVLPMRTCSSRPSPTGKTRRARFGWRRVPTRSTQSRSGLWARSDCDRHLALDVDDDAGRRVAAPGAQVEDAGEALRGRGGQRGRGLAAAQQRLHLAGAAALGVGVEVGPGRPGERRAAARLLRDLDRRPQRVVAQAARRVLGDQRPVGGERVLAVARGAEARRHVAVEVADGQRARCRSSRCAGSGRRPCGTAGRRTPTPRAS